MTGIGMTAEDRKLAVRLLQRDLARGGKVQRTPSALGVRLVLCPDLTLGRNTRQAKYSLQIGSSHPGRTLQETHLINYQIN